MRAFTTSPHHLVDIEEAPEFLRVAASNAIVDGLNQLLECLPDEDKVTAAYEHMGVAHA